MKPGPSEKTSRRGPLGTSRALPSSRWGTLATAFLLSLSLLLHSLPARALGRLESESAALNVGGSIRTTPAVLLYYDSPLFGEGNTADALSQTRLRLTLAARFGRVLRMELHAVQGLDFSSSEVASGLGLTGGGGGALRYRPWAGSWELAKEEPDLSAPLGFDRLNLKLTLGRVDITLGRQAIHFGKAWFWNPLDTFLPFDPASFDRDYKPGVDAARVDLSLGESSGLNLIAAPGRTLTYDLGSGKAESGEEKVDASFHGTSLLGRAYTTLRGWDLSLQGGKVYGGYQVGGGFSGDLFSLGIRGEVSYTFATEAEPEKILTPEGEIQEVDLVPSHFRAVVGVDRRWDNSLYLAAEYFFNGAGDDDDLLAPSLRLSLGETPNLSRHLVGLLVRYDFLPILTGSLSVILAPGNSSALLSPGLSISVSDNVSADFGALIGLGPRPEEGEGLLYPRPVSEFGTYPQVIYLQYKHYF